MGILLLLGFNVTSYSQESAIDSLRLTINKTPENSQERFLEVMELASKYRELKMTKEFFLNNLSVDYQSYGIPALAWAVENGSPENIARARRFEFDYWAYFRGKIDKNNYNVFLLGQQMIANGVFYSPEDEYFIYRKLADTYQEKEFYKEFLDLIPKTYALGRQLNKPYSENYHEYESIGTVYYRLNDYTKARYYYRKTLNSISSDTLSLFKASINNNMALSFAKQEKVDSAIYYYNRSLKIIETGVPEYYDGKTRQYNEHIKNVIKANIAYLGIKKGEYDKAIHSIKRELFTGKREIEPSTIVQAYNKLGEIYYLKKDYNIAEKFLDSAKPFFGKGFYDTDRITNLRHRAKVLLATNQQDEAELLFLEAQKFEDSIKLVKSIDQTKVAAVLYETQTKEKELQSQRLALAEKNEEILIKEKSQIIYSVIVIILFVSLLAFYWFNRKIQSQKKLVDDSLKEKELLLKEIHHRVKNNLQVVSSLLIKQGAISDNKQVKRLMEDGQNRIKSMAVVHQLLYQTEDFRNLNLKDYTQILSNSISHSQQFHNKEIDLEIDMDDITSHIDIAVPYGLILNELISNCFEHGFPNGGPGKIKISVKKIEGYQYKLTVSDNGKGIPDNIQERMKKSLGLNLIEGLAWQLRGSLSFQSLPDKTLFEVTFHNNLNVLS
jgi:two-component sensor histidine kinase